AMPQPAQRFLARAAAKRRPARGLRRERQQLAAQLAQVVAVALVLAPAEASRERHGLLRDDRALARSRRGREPLVTQLVEEDDGALPHAVRWMAQESLRDIQGG